MNGAEWRSDGATYVDVTYDAETLSPREYGLMVQKMLNGLYESAKQGREAQIE